MYHPSVDLSPHRSSLEDSRYSSGIHCPAVGMITPVASCESRLTTENVKAACTVEDCPRFRPTVATIKTERVEIKKVVVKKPRKPKVRKIGPCACCGVDGQLRARGLMQICYDRINRKGMLGLYPTKLFPKQTEAKT